ncbi:MAG: sedoheptulose 7-phosphate cyclase [Planctomycetota bacterium]
MSATFESTAAQLNAKQTLAISKPQQLAGLFLKIDPNRWGHNASGVNQQIMADDQMLFDFIEWLAEENLNDEEIAKQFNEHGMVRCLKPLRNIQYVLSVKLSTFVVGCSELARELGVDSLSAWNSIGDRCTTGRDDDPRLIDLFSNGRFRIRLNSLAEQLVDRNPHAIYPTSTYRSSGGHVVANEDCSAVEAIMSLQTHTSIRVIEHVLDPADPTLVEVYKAHGRCVCLVDSNVQDHYSEELSQYFEAHGIRLDKLVYRAMESDKGIRTVEKILGDFKSLGVARNEPVLIVGGGVLSDVGGLACGLYHRGTPYVMLSTSLVAGVDAGPSPRTCCDGFGFKNLFGAYHAPILSITDRTFFRTLKPGWLRHGIAEIIKMASVKDKVLFQELEHAGQDLIHSRFGSTNCAGDEEIKRISQSIIGRAITSYVDAEYGNLYETHQCRPHAFGHTWSPGFEIPAGLLHGHAVSVGMGFGAFVSNQLGWIDSAKMDRIHNLIQTFGLSMWHDQLDDHGLIWDAQIKMVQKRGGHLVAPLPKHEIGQCGYLEDLGRDDLVSLIQSYKNACRSLPRGGIGIEPLCIDVGLESPSMVGC